MIEMNYTIENNVIVTGDMCECGHPICIAATDPHFAACDNKTCDQYAPASEFWELVDIDTFNRIFLEG